MSQEKAAVVLAAGKGTRMESELPKVLHEIHGKPIISYIIEIDNNEIGTDRITIKLATEKFSVELLERLKDHFRAKLRVSPVISFVSPEEINSLKFPNTSRKPVLFIDKRDSVLK